MRKRFTYGTLIIDLNSGKTIDMIESRKLEDVVLWLKSYKNIELVSRDGSYVYKSAIEQAFPDASQVSDRFHLIKNLTDYAKKEFFKLIPHTIKVTNIHKKENLNYYELKAKLDNKAQNTEAYERKLLLIEKVKNEYAKVNSIRAVSRNLKINKATVKKYLDGFIPLKKKPKIVPLDKFRNVFIKKIQENKSVMEMHEYAVEQGLETKYSNTRAYIDNLKTEMDFQECPKVIIETEIIILHRKDIIKTLFGKGIRDLGLNEVEIGTFKHFLKTNPNVLKLINLVTEFKIILNSGDKTKLDKWVEIVEKTNFKKIKTFAAGIKKDYEAVCNAIELPFSNGMIEGKINKLKKIKREMYGRASFELLKNKIFLVENQLN